MSSDNEFEILEIINRKLLVEDNQPIRIYLEGFKTSELLKLPEIIEIHGGELSEYPGVGIIILSPPDYLPPTTGQRFNINWLYESISLNKIQYLLHYKLKPRLNVKIEADHKPQDENVLPILTDKEEEDPIEVDHEPLDENAMLIVVEEDKENHFHRIASPSKKAKIVTRSAKQQKTKSTILATCSRNETGNYNNGESLVSAQKRKYSKRSVANPICACARVSPYKKEYRVFGSSYTADEEQIMIDFLIQHDGITKAGGPVVWERLVEEKKLNRTAYSLQAHFNTALKYRVKDFTNDEQVLAEFKKREDKIQRNFPGRSLV